MRSLLFITKFNQIELEYCWNFNSPNYYCAHTYSSCSYDLHLLFCFHGTGRFFQCLHTLVSCGLSGPTSPLAFAEAALGAIGQSAASLQNKEQLWRMWSTVVNPLTDTITLVGKCVTLFLPHYCINRVKRFCGEIFRGSCEAQNKYSLANSFCLITVK